MRNVHIILLAYLLGAPRWFLLRKCFAGTYTCFVDCCSTAALSVLQLPQPHPISEDVGQSLRKVGSWPTQDYPSSLFQVLGLHCVPHKFRSAVASLLACQPFASLYMVILPFMRSNSYYEKPLAIPKIRNMESHYAQCAQADSDLQRAIRDQDLRLTLLHRFDQIENLLNTMNNVGIWIQNLA